MIRRFIVGVDGLTADAEIKFRAFLEEFGAGFWHWIENFWLITAQDEDISAEKIADKLEELKSKRNLVFEIPEELSWYGYGYPNAAGKGMFEWLQTTWADKSD